MPTSKEGFVSSFEYAGELHVESSGVSPLKSPAERGGSAGRGVEEYMRHLHLNNGTGEKLVVTFSQGEGVTEVFVIYENVSVIDAIVSLCVCVRGVRQKALESQRFFTCCSCESEYMG